MVRAPAVLLVLAALAGAEDWLHLENGRLLRGAVVEETPSEVVLDLGSGRIHVPRERIRLLERGATRTEPRRVVTECDEWFLVLHRGKVAGWRRLVRIGLPGRVQVEERTVFFRPGGGTDVDIRRVEVADRAGRPLEFLLMESYGTSMEVTSGQVRGGKVHVRVARDGGARHEELSPPARWELALTAWSRFQETARPGETRSVLSLDLRRLATVRLLLRRDAQDQAAPGGDPRPCARVTLTGDRRTSRTLYRPGEGAVHVELNGATLVAQRTTRERVELAREAHKAPPPLSLEDAQRYPFHRRTRDLRAFQARAGLRLDAPDAGWIPEVREADKGLVLSFEKVALFASVEVFAYPLPAPGADVAACFERALARLRLTAGEVAVEGEVEDHEAGGLPARTAVVRARHRGEDLRCLLTAVRAGDRTLVVVGAAPERWWRWAERDFRRFVASLVVVP